MIKFTYTDEHREEYGTGVSVEVTTNAEHLEAVVNSFTTFLLHLGHHPDNVARIVIEGKEERQALVRGDGNPDQSDFFVGAIP